MKGKICKKCYKPFMKLLNGIWKCGWCGYKEKIKIDEKFSKDGK